MSQQAATATEASAERKEGPAQAETHRGEPEHNKRKARE
jgi:hypothetical protein